MRSSERWIKYFEFSTSTMSAWFIERDLGTRLGADVTVTMFISDVFLFFCFFIPIKLR